MTTSYEEEGSCYPFDKDYMKYWCTGSLTTSSSVYSSGNSDKEGETMEVEKVTVISVLSVMGTIIFGLLGLQFYQHCKGNDEVG